MCVHHDCIRERYLFSIQRQEIEAELPYVDASGRGHCNPSTRVLGCRLLPEIWKDMDKMVLPSWLRAGPLEIGSTPSGKLSADQWRTTCTVHLVITLGKFWGIKPHDGHFYAMYKNFMDLVMAMKLATM